MPMTSLQFSRAGRFAARRRDRRSGAISSAIARVISRVPSARVPRVARSAVRAPLSSAASTARSHRGGLLVEAERPCREAARPTRSPRSGSRCPSPRSAGAEPWTGSKSPGPSPRLADGRSPSEPDERAALVRQDVPEEVLHDEDVEARDGKRTRLIAQESTSWCSSVTSGWRLPTSVTTARQSCEVSRTFDLSTDVTLFRRVFGEPERFLDDPVDLGARVRQRVDGRARREVERSRLAVVEAARQLADDDEVEAARDLGLERAGVREGPEEPGGPEVRVDAERLAELEEAGLRALRRTARRRTPDRRRRRGRRRPTRGTPRASPREAASPSRGAPRAPTCHSDRTNVCPKRASTAFRTRRRPPSPRVRCRRPAGRRCARASPLRLRTRSPPRRRARPRRGRPPRRDARRARRRAAGSRARA